MSTTLSDDETQLETQLEDEQYENPERNEEVDESISTKEVATKVIEEKRERREPVEQEREPGRSLFPISRVQKIIKADKEIPIVAKEATFLIALATEEFIKRLCEAGQQVAQGEKRSTIQHKDIAAVVRKADEFLFLEEIMPYSAVQAPAVKRPRAKPAATDDSERKKSGNKQSTLYQFAAGNKMDEDEDDNGDFIMNEDGTMYAAGNADDEMI